MGKFQAHFPVLTYAFGRLADYGSCFTIMLPFGAAEGKHSDAAAQRARGRVHVMAAPAGGRTRLADLRQEGCLHACFPREDGPALQAVLVNSAGGVADGDWLATRLMVGGGGHLVAAGQAAERYYRARPGAAPARVAVTLHVEAGARLDYLPQETILFSGSALVRHLDATLDGSGTYLGVETLVFGRRESGEFLRDVSVRDTVTIRRDGRLVVFDSVRLRDPAALAGRAGAGGAGAVVTLYYVAPDAAGFLAPVRLALAGHAAISGASVRDGVLVVRLVASDSRAARLILIDAVAPLMGVRPLPRVWGC